ncbi:hypothetical protein JAAARDRAFT_34504 [Jaapia argillacea MUCL 33604]|uniref:CFA20 domain-containing protein n=1 Tax=Jaapia argillacea MUCL 33604 TaxID=933084 RepID=A0A067PVC0_9AGAM|nr:hypothetical protein JAAARDRAFT_34504 [Jaapia argillacea MUCL 33604]
MFSSVQPSLISLFSSTGSQPLSLFSAHTDQSLPADSAIHLLNDSSGCSQAPSPAALISPTDINRESDRPEDYALNQTVLHIQSPTLRTTYIRCPPTHRVAEASGRARSAHLGLKHPWVHFQVRNLGKAWSFEVGVVDQSGREGIIRCSTFQRDPCLKLSSPPLLHLPLSFPPSSSHPLTSWATIALNLPSLLLHFSSPNLMDKSRDPLEGETETDDDDLDNDDPGKPLPHRILNGAVPTGIYSHVSFIKVHATCRLRRIWFSEGGPTQNSPWEFQMYAAE